VFPVRYEMNPYILFRINLALKALNKIHSCAYHSVSQQSPKWTRTITRKVVREGTRPASRLPPEVESDAC
jgi:hypothetical protein